VGYTEFYYMIMKNLSHVFTALSGAMILSAAICVFAAEPSPVDSVRPFVGTAAHGHVYPGATVPFGMVQLSPDTRLETWDGCSGYHDSDKTILGFSHTHVSGTGRGDFGDIRVQPLSGKMPKQQKTGYPQAFSHADEKASPGYYCVTFSDPKIKAELTATAHAGFHRYTFPKGDEAHLAFDLGRGIRNNPIEGRLVVESKTRLSGYRRSSGWSKDKTFYFVAELSRPFDSIGFENDRKPLPNDKTVGQGKWLVAHLDFKDAAEPILMKIGLSPVRVEAARRNLAAEIPGMDFDATAAAAKKAWSEALGRIDIRTSDPAVRETFYTALYHASIAPTLYNDADGGYRGLDHEAHPAEGFQNYCTFSLWDTFRAEHPLLTIVQPGRVDDFVASMLASYRQFGEHCTPVWTIAGYESWCMIGFHSIPVMVDAYRKGFRRYDVEAAYQAIRDTMLQDRNELKEYRERGYVSTTNDKKDHKRSVSLTLEYAYDDWCVAEMAKMLGKKVDAELFYKRAQNYRNVFDPPVGFMRGRHADGKWREPFNPRELFWPDYVEATAWNYTWFVPQDVPGLVELMGGNEKFVAKLDEMFADKAGLVAATQDLSGIIGQYIHGNEPCHHIAYLYNDAGAPWKTQAWVRRIMTTLYNNRTDGLCGNDDCGQISAWYVLSAMGFYPVNPASGVYAIGSPLLDKATIRLDPKFQKGKEFTIKAENNSPKNVYIQSGTLNGKPLERTWFTHDELAAGGELVLKMGPEPNRQWGN
jgi:predicted alpha-1,2-mannosidase